MPTLISKKWISAKLWNIIGYLATACISLTCRNERNMKNLLTLCIILSSFVTIAQNKFIDSLQQALKNYDAQRLELRKNLMSDESDTAKVNILNSLSEQYWRVSDYNPARKYADDAMAIAKEIGFKKGIAKSYSNIGIIYYYQGSFPDALKNHFVSLKISEETRNKKEIASSYNNIGLIYHNQGNFPEALKYYFASLKIFEEFRNKKNIASAYNNIGNIYYDQGNYQEALNNYFASLKIKEEIGDKYGIGTSYTNIGNIYSQQGNYPEALKNHIASLRVNEVTGNKNGIAMSYYNVGEIYVQQGNYREALKKLFASLKIYKEIEDKVGIAASSINIGNTKLKMQAAAEAKDWLTKGLQLAKEMEAIPYIKDSFEGLAQADSALGNFNDAYKNYKLFILYRDSLNNEEATKITLQSKMQFAFDKKETETKALTDEELKKQKLVRNGFVGGFAIVMLFAGVFFMQRNKTKKEKLRSDILLLNILPGEVADEIKTTGTAKAKSYTMVTVMFTDFKDFTTVSEMVSAELLVDEIHTCFSAFDNIIQKHKIEKIKTIGDAYLCASGLPVSNYTHAVDMLNAAFEIRNYMLQRKKEKEARGEIPFELRIGIHTGPVVAGIVGVRKYAYDIWGDTVNLAARMEQNSEVGKINISGSTYELIKDKFSCTHRGKIEAKHKGEIDMYFVETDS